MQREIGGWIGIGNRYTRFDMIARPAKRGIADAGIVDDARHTGQDACHTSCIGRISWVPQPRLAHCPGDSDFNELMLIGRKSHMRFAPLFGQNVQASNGSQ
jgi:hypothetical protein